MKNKIRTICFFLILALSLMTVSTPVAKAEVWGTNVLSTTLKSMMEKIVEQIRSAIVAALKQAAVEIVNSTVNNLISGGAGDGGAMFISDWRQTLIDDPRKEAQSEVNSYVNQMLRGKGSVSNYFSGAEGVVGGFASQIERSANSIFLDQVPRMGVMDYTSDPTDLFQDNTLKALGQIAQNPYDSLGTAINLNVKGMAIETFQEKQLIASDQAKAYDGYKGAGSGGMISTPGSHIKDIQADVANLGNLALANAQNIPEVITSMVTKVVTSTIRQGIGNAKRNIQKEINNTVGTYRDEFNKSNPVDRFKPNY